jgi:hypothetical protein
MASQHYRSKTMATWLALLGGTLGLHRFYMHGLSSVLAWLYPIPAALGIIGMQRMAELGQDDVLSWWLTPCLGLVLAAAMLEGIVMGLMSDTDWHQRYNAQFGTPEQLPTSGWPVVFGLVFCLLIGAGVLMATIAFAGQRYFEYQVIEAQKLSQ